METKKDILDFLKPRERETLNSDYFSNMASNAIVQANLQKQKTKARIIRRTFYWVSSIAAIIFLILRVETIDSTVKCDFNSISTSELYSYIDNNIDDFDENLLIHYLKIEPTDTTKKSNSNNEIKINPNQSSEINNSQIKSDPFENINEEDILKYLENEGVSEEELEEEING